MTHKMYDLVVKEVYTFSYVYNLPSKCSCEKILTALCFAAHDKNVNQATTF